MLRGRSGEWRGVQALVESLKEGELGGTFQLKKLVAEAEGERCLAAEPATVAKTLSSDEFIITQL